MITKRVLILCGLATCAAAATLAVNPGPPPVPQTQDKTKFRGSRMCSTCHSDYHKDWAETRHARAFESLTAEQVASGKDDKGQACLACHTTGYEKGGFVSLEETPRLAGVGCEACHGPGGDHIQVMVAADDPENVANLRIAKSISCKECHDPHVSHKKIYGDQ